MNHAIYFCLMFSQFFALLSAITIPDDYDPNLRPNSDGVADVINVSLDILAIREVNEDLQHISVEFLLHTFWDDKRLANLVERETIFADASTTSPTRIWTPHLSITNSAESPTRSGKTLSLKPEGTVDYSERISTKISCHMSMIRYPFGRQHCTMQFVSYGYSSIHLILIWNGIIPLEFISTFDPEYVLTNIEQSSERQKAGDGIQKTSNYMIAVSLSLRRSPYRLIATSLLPTFLLATCSYFVTLFMGVQKRRQNKDIHNKSQSEMSCCESEKKTLDEEDQPESNSHGVEIEETQHVTEELQMPKINPSNTPTFIVDIIKTGVNVFMLLIVAVVKQTIFINSPRSSLPTALDIWIGFMSLGIFICFLLQLQICFRKWKMAGLALDDNYSERSRSFNVLRVSIPVAFLIFLFVFIGLCFS